MYGLFDRVVTRIERAVMLTAYTILILVIGGETIRRMVFASQAAWGPEVAMNAFVWLSWFAMSANVRNKTHLAFYGIRHKLPPKVQRGLAIFDCFLWMAVGLVVISTSYDVVMMHWQLGQIIFGTSIPLAAVSIAVPLGWGFTMLRILQDLYALLYPNARDVLAAQQKHFDDIEAQRQVRE